MFDPPIGSGANIFIIIAVCIIAVGAASTVLDIYKKNSSKNKAKKK